jgi:hypothetical protein
LNKGMQLEDICVAYLRSARGCKEFYYDDANVRFKLGLSKDDACADILALHQPEAAGPVKEVTVMEAKPSARASSDHIANQLGNAAAGVLAYFPLAPGGKLPEVNLVVWTDKLVWRQDASKQCAAGIKIVAAEVSWPDGKCRPTLCDITGAAILRPFVTLTDKKYRNSALATSTLLIEVALASGISKRAGA